MKIPLYLNNKKIVLEVSDIYDKDLEEYIERLNV